MEGLREAAGATGQNLLVQGAGPMFNTGFTDLKFIKDYRDTLSFDRVKLRKFISGMQDSGIRIIGRGLWYISAAHTEADIDEAVRKATEVLRSL
jgi:glutamate-1-semialdehyde 2,1-aminomutase